MVYITIDSILDLIKHINRPCLPSLFNYDFLIIKKYLFQYVAIKHILGNVVQKLCFPNLFILEQQHFILNLEIPELSSKAGEMAVEQFLQSLIFKIIFKIPIALLLIQNGTGYKTM